MADFSHTGATTFPCAKCGAAVSQDQKFCMNCGTPVTPPVSCPSCGAPAEENAKFCQFCGTRMAPEPASPPPPSPAAAPPPVVPEKRPRQVPVPAAEEEVPVLPESPEPVPKQPLPEKPLVRPDAEPALSTAPSPERSEPELIVPTAPLKKPKQKKKGSLLKAGALMIVAAICIVLVYFAVPGISPGSFSEPSTLPTVTETPQLPAPTVEETPAVVRETTPVPTPAAGNLVPGPVDTLPPGTEVHLSVGPKDPSDATVTVLFEGGPGMNVIRTCVVRLTRSDGEVVTGMLDTSTRGSEVKLPGTRGTDRLEVLVRQFTGNTYTIIDQLIPYR